ncbi:hypothetical protein [Campylobacter helveticus]|uniref:hypothetical protein n=1 Tax=Campylobacter helveticus TaxID=28898 RepID=UPI0009C24C09|nr:hypothetical protein [Campylobacter helveticus]ARE81272.1 putative membrane protein [Campylobacter helveticus]MCR2054717.1 hypothetical protein [Campylobacter helveticus]TNB58629.1 hypothetical protein FDW44_04595 [Campylobacter helveticus]TNH34395.1 hypothetical protein FDW48_02970 [Campylobacter helveticus]TXK57018.1 hypothetical protein A9726_02285 [Campylobacter helveticus]
MKKFFQDGFLAIFLSFFAPISSFALDAVIYNENVLSQKVSSKINLIGKELYEKTGIFLALAVGDKISLESLTQKQKDLPQPSVLLVLSKESHKVDIVGSSEALSFFDKEAVLSPYAGTGTILPILASKKGDIYNAALLNGYADIADRLARYFKIELENSIGNANRDTLNILRILLYGFICFALLYYTQRRMKKRHQSQETKRRRFG